MRTPDLRLCLLVLSFIPVLSSAQKITKSTQEFEWSTARLTNGTSVDNKNGLKHVFDKYVLPISEKEKVIPIAIGKKQWGIARVNQDGKVIWQFTGTDDDLLGIGLIGADIIAIYADDALKPKMVNAILVNGTKGNRLKEKTIYEPASPTKTEIKVQNTANGVFSDVMIAVEERKAGTSIQILYCNADLSVSKTVFLKPTFPLTKFAGSLVNDMGEVFLADFSEDQFVVAKFNKEGKELKKVSAPLARRSDDFTTTLQLDIKNAEVVVVGLNYRTERKEWANQILRFDMAANKVISSEDEILEKDYANGLTLEQVKGIRDGNLKWIGEAEIAGMVQWENKLILIKEIRTSLETPKNGRFVSNDTRSTSILANQKKERFINHAWIVSIYDANLKLEKTLGLDKRYESFVPSSLSLGFNLQQDRLYVISPVLVSIGSSSVVFASINLRTGLFEKAISMDQLKSGGASAIEAGATLWFNGICLLQQLRSNGSFFNRASNCILNKVEM